MPVKKIPERMCTGCMARKPKKEMVRVIRSPEGEIAIDLVGKKAGRGAYICKDINCLKTARKKKSLERALECQIPAEIYDRMERELTGE